VKLDYSDNAVVATDSITIPASQSQRRDAHEDDVNLTQRRPKTADAELSSVRTTSVATQTSPMHVVISTALAILAGRHRHSSIENAMMLGRLACDQRTFDTSV